MEFVEPSIAESVELNANFPRVCERYFTELFYIPAEKNNSDQGIRGNGSESTKSSGGDLNKEKNESDTSGSNKQSGLANLDNFEHTCVLVHSNKICLISISHHHPVLSENKEIKEISFNVGKFNRLENQVKGKSKRGAQMFGPRSSVCIITCSDGSKYTVLAGVSGKLIEVNERLLSHPQLLTKSPKEEGYLAIVLPPLHNGDKSLSNLLSKDDYEKKIKCIRLVSRFIGEHLSKNKC